MLALETGWTPPMLRELPAAFRAACHWALFVRSIVGDEGLPTVRIPKGAPIEARTEAMRLSVEIKKVREALFPEDADV